MLLYVLIYLIIQPQMRRYHADSSNEMYDDMFNACEVLSDPSVGIDYSCIRDSLIRTTDSDNVVMLPIFTTSYGMLVNMDIFEKEGLKVPNNYNELMDV